MQHPPQLKDMKIILIKKAGDCRIFQNIQLKIVNLIFWAVDYIYSYPTSIREFKKILLNSRSIKTKMQYQTGFGPIM